MTLMMSAMCLRKYSRRTGLCGDVGMLSKNGIGVSYGTTIARRPYNGALSEPIDNDWRLWASTYNRSDQSLNLRVNHQYISPPCYPWSPSALISRMHELGTANRNGKRRPTRTLSRGNTISRSFRTRWCYLPWCFRFSTLNFSNVFQA